MHTQYHHQPNAIDLEYYRPHLPLPCIIITIIIIIIITQFQKPIVFLPFHGEWQAESTYTLLQESAVTVAVVVNTVAGSGIRSCTLQSGVLAQDL